MVAARLLIAFLVSVSAFAGTAAPAHAAPSLQLSPASGLVGASVSAAGSGFPSRSRVVVAFGSTRVAETRTSRSGGFAVTFTVPVTASGTATVSATVASVRASASFEVLAPPAPSTGAVDVWRPAPRTTWHWQLTGPVDQSVDAQMYDVDLFDTPASVVADLHAKGRRVVCYLSAGSFEDWRADAGSFPEAVKGDPLDGWPGERWLDIRRLDVLGPIMERRMDLCREKGFDGVEPDNVDGYSNRSGFSLTAADQLAYNRFLARAAHARGLSIGLKNDLGQVAELEPDFDWALNESCYAYRECDLLTPFVAAGKAVFHVEYDLATSQFCADARSRGFMSMRKNWDLGAWRETCW